MKIFKLKTAILFSTFLFFGFLSPVLAAPEVVSYKIDGKQESARINPSRGDVVSIEINTNAPVKFSRIAICKVDDSTDSNCSDGVRYFTYSKKDDPHILSITKLWDGKTTDGIVVLDGDYKIKVKMKDEISTEYKYIQELSPYIITIDSSFAGAVRAEVLHRFRKVLQARRSLAFRLLHQLPVRGLLILSPLIQVHQRVQAQSQNIPILLK